MLLKFLQISQEKSLPEPLLNEVVGLYSATLLKEKTPVQMFSDKLVTYLFYSTKKYFTGKIVKNPLKKDWKQLVRKRTVHPEKKLKHYFRLISIQELQAKDLIFAIGFPIWGCALIKKWRNLAINQYFLID